MYILPYPIALLIYLICYIQIIHGITYACRKSVVLLIWSQWKFSRFPVQVLLMILSLPSEPVPSWRFPCPSVRLVAPVPSDTLGRLSSNLGYAEVVVMNRESCRFLRVVVEWNSYVSNMWISYRLWYILRWQTASFQTLVTPQRWFLLEWETAT